ncbi:hypothetical protein C4573_02345 [Candidatus Woesearchaeota archaeon]|nr:MAG: hypothetical protein C4573_02345 [Candidatus Woesearchaeota archaeon]
MGEKIPLNEPIRILYNGIFDFDGVYRFMYDWIIREGYDFHEKRYKDKPDTHGGSEAEIEWECDRKETEYIKQHLFFYFHTRDAVEVEVVVNGVKKTMTKARLEIRLSCFLELDWQNRFKGKISKLFGELLMKKILKWEWILKYGDDLYYRVYGLGEQVKTFLNMSTDKGAY